MDIAVLDLGSTTFHLQHIRVDDAGKFSTTLDAKRSLCLGSQVFVDGYLDEHSWLESLKAFRELLDASDAAKPDQRQIVATSAIRSASNGTELIREIERIHRVQIRILSPQEEARLAYLGQSTSEVVGGRRVAAVDMGGGSVEIAVGEGTRCIYTASLPVGALRMRARNAGAAYGVEEARWVARLVRKRMSDTLQAVRELEPEVVVFGSGSARAARKLLLRNSNVPGKVGPLEVGPFQAALEAHLGCTEERLIEYGVEPARAPSVLVAATIMLQVLLLLEGKHIYVSDKGLRDGVALEMYRDRPVELRSPVGSAFA